MGEMITAIYEKGILRPPRRLALPERARVGLQTIVQYENETDERPKVRQVLLDAGVIRPHPPANMPSPISEADLLAAAQTVGASGPLSTVILTVHAADSHLNLVAEAEGLATNNPHPHL